MPGTPRMPRPWLVYRLQSFLPYDLAGVFLQTPCHYLTIQLGIEEDGLDLFQITDRQEQVLTALLSETNIYPILGSISRPIAAAAKKQTGVAQPKIDYKNAESMEVWHRCVTPLNAQDIIRLSKDPRSGVVIKGAKGLPFCEACKLAGTRRKIPNTAMPRSKRRGGMLHVDTGGGQTLGDPHDISPSFSGAKYLSSLQVTNIDQIHKAFDARIPPQDGRCRSNYQCVE